MLCPVTYSVVRSGNVMSSILLYYHVMSCLEKEKATTTKTEKKENFILLFLERSWVVGETDRFTGHIDQAGQGSLTASGTLVHFPDSSACP